MGNSQRITSFYDVPMWESIDKERWALQSCTACSTFRYPPSPICPKCRCMESEWKPLGGEGTVASWSVFHKKYFDDHVPPYTCVAVRLDEGPIVITNLVDPVPPEGCIDRRVRLVYARHASGVLPKMTFLQEEPTRA